MARTCDTHAVSGASPSSPLVDPQSTGPESGAPLPTADYARARVKERTREVEEASEKRKNFLGLIRGSKLRVGVVQAETDGLGLEALTASLGLTVSSLMLMQIVNGALPVKDAEQAAKVAKLGLDIHRALAATEPEAMGDLTPEERTKRRAATESAIRDLAKNLMERANAEAARAADPASPAPAPSLAIVPTPPPVRAQEA